VGIKCGDPQKPVQDLNLSCRRDRTLDSLLPHVLRPARQKNANALFFFGVV
jgi:hypothetical protein